ncbi:MAG: HNH endonuclease [Actinobacteria bacterium]|nr:HNH endonuclease [Actinomycetota bacterium]
MNERTSLGTFAARPEAERFWEKVNKDDSSGCWLWTSTLNIGGYGYFKVAVVGSAPSLWLGEKPQAVYRHCYAHRWAWIDTRGPIPDGLTLDHLCRVRHCVNPNHLEPVTIDVNINRGNPRSKQLAARTHCNAGHPYDEANTYQMPDGSRRCRACQAEAARRYNAQAKKQRMQDPK